MLPDFSSRRLIVSALYKDERASEKDHDVYYKGEEERAPSYLLAFFGKVLPFAQCFFASERDFGLRCFIFFFAPSAIRNFPQPSIKSESHPVKHEMTRRRSKVRMDS